MNSASSSDSDVPQRGQLIVAGVALFAADLSRRGFAGEALFPRAAPIGGFGMLGGWLVLAVSALFAKRG